MKSLEPEPPPLEDRKRMERSPFGGAFEDGKRKERHEKKWKGPKHSPSGNHYKGMPC